MAEEKTGNDADNGESIDYNDDAEKVAKAKAKSHDEDQERLRQEHEG